MRLQIERINLGSSAGSNGTRDHVGGAGHLQPPQLDLRQARRHEHDRSVMAQLHRAQAFERFHAVEPRHRHVQQDEIGPQLADDDQRFESRRARHDGELRLVRQCGSHQLAHGGIVVDVQNTAERFR